MSAIRDSKLHKGPAALAAECVWKVKSWQNKSPIWHDVRVCRDKASKAFSLFKQTAKVTPAAVAGHASGLASDVKHSVSRSGLLGNCKAGASKLLRTAGGLSGSLAQGGSKFASNASGALGSAAGRMEQGLNSLKSRSRKIKQNEAATYRVTTSRAMPTAKKAEAIAVADLSTARVDASPVESSGPRTTMLTPELARLILQINSAGIGARFSDAVVEKANRLTGASE